MLEFKRLENQSVISVLYLIYICTAYFVYMTCFALCSSFYADFGPLNLAMLYKYCCKLNKKLKVILMFPISNSAGLCEYLSATDFSLFLMYFFFLCFGLESPSQYLERNWSTTPAVTRRREPMLPFSSVPTL